MEHFNVFLWKKGYLFHAFGEIEYREEMSFVYGVML